MQNKFKLDSVSIKSPPKRNSNKYVARYFQVYNHIATIKQLSNIEKHIASYCLFGLSTDKKDSSNKTPSFVTLYFTFIIYKYWLFPKIEKVAQKLNICIWKNKLNLTKKILSLSLSHTHTHTHTHTH